MMATNSSSQPTCQNCATSTTPLWRRDEFGSVLCNACGLFLKLHGRPRPISLKTDVIKSRNRVKTMRPDLAAKKKVSPSLAGFARHALHAERGAQTAATAAQAMQRTAPGVANGGPGLDAAGPEMGSLYSQPALMDDEAYPAPFAGAGAGSPSLNGDRALGEAPQTHEQLIAHNSSLKTRVSELEVINELFRGRLSQLEQQEAAARRGQEVAALEQAQLRSQLEASQESEAQLRAQLDDSHRRENNLKRRLDELELERKEAAAPDRALKKPRLDPGDDGDDDEEEEEEVEEVEEEEEEEEPKEEEQEAAQQQEEQPAPAGDADGAVHGGSEAQTADGPPEAHGAERGD